MNKIAKFSLKTATIAIITTLMSAGNAHSQGQVYVDAQIPVAVNVDAHVSITPPPPSAEALGMQGR